MPVSSYCYCVCTTVVCTSLVFWLCLPSNAFFSLCLTHPLLRATDGMHKFIHCEESVTGAMVEPWLGCHGHFSLSSFNNHLSCFMAPWYRPMKHQMTSFFEQNKARRLSLAPEMCLNSTETSSGCSLPNMADVLKGLGKVKLRSVERYGTNFVKLFKEAQNCSVDIS